MRRALPPVLLLLVLLGVGLGLDVGTARPAAAHATVVTTTPADGARLTAAPAEVTVEFDEDVSLGAGYARVLGQDGRRVDAGAPAVRDKLLTVPLRDALPAGSYVVTWRVVSADSHPVSGAWSFVVGDGELVAPSAADIGAAADPVVAAALPAARWLGYLGLALGLGVPVFLLACWPAGWSVPLMRRLTRAGLAAVAVGGVLSVLLQGPYAAGAGLTGVVDLQLLGTTAGSVYGLTVLLRVVLAAVLAVVLLLGGQAGRAPGRPLLGVAAGLALALVLTVATVGHPVAGELPALAVAVTAVHVAAMSCWLGGLAALLGGVLAREVPLAALRPVLPRWSQLAAGLVTALVLTGVLQSVREVGSPSALVHTAYGWLLLAKVAVVVAVLLAAALSRDWVQTRMGGRPRRPPAARRVAGSAYRAPEERAAAVAVAVAAVEDTTPVPLRVLRRTVLVEAVGALVVLALSAVLVGTPPAKAAVAAPVEVTLPLQSAAGAAGNGSVQVSLAPATPGPTSLHVYLYDAAGRLTQPRDISVTLTEPQQQIGPLDVDLATAGPGHYVGDGATLPAAGTWTLAVTVRLDEFTAVTASTVFPVR
ncbi:MAG TPA: copper resistance CopC family protein [Modestobacter sp.]|nr:copper resistance CopC family protein [Modestobacter sp.]